MSNIIDTKDDNKVKVICQQHTCLHNLVFYTKKLHCNLKHITINKNGACANFELNKTNDK